MAEPHTPARVPRCWSCRHYSRQATGPHAWRHQCAEGVVGCPLMGPQCPLYDYEPGSDAKEMQAA